MPVIALPPVRRRGNADLAGPGRQASEHPASIAFKNLETRELGGIKISLPPPILAFGQRFKQDFAGDFIGRVNAARRVLVGGKLRLDRCRDAEIYDLGLVFAS